MWTLKKQKLEQRKERKEENNGLDSPQEWEERKVFQNKRKTSYFLKLALFIHHSFITVSMITVHLPYSQPSPESSLPDSGKLSSSFSQT